MNEKLEIILIQAGYRKMTSNTPEFTIYIAGDMSRAQVVQVVDLTRGQQFTIQQFHYIKQYTLETFHGRGYQGVHFLTLILTNNANEVEKISATEPTCWIIDTSNNRLCIFENQISDFYGLRRKLENLWNPSYQGYIPQLQKKSFYHDEESPVGFLRKKFSQINFSIIIVNIVVFIILSFLGSEEDVNFMIAHGAMYGPSIVIEHEYYRFFTCIFLHFGIEHLASNMIALYCFGDNLERAVGKIKYLVIYLVSGISGSICSFLFFIKAEENVASVGASGAIFGVIGALLYVVIRNKGKLEDMTTFRIIILIAYFIFSGLTNESIDNAAHFGGLVAGFIISVLLYRKEYGERS